MIDLIIKKILFIVPTTLLCYIAYKFNCYNVLVIYLLVEILYEVRENK